MPCACLVALIAAAASAGPAPPPRELVRFDPPPAIEVSGKLGDGQRPQDLLAGNLHGGCLLSPLKGTVVTLRFPSPVRLGSLGLAQAGWSNWDHPRRLRVTCDDRPPFEVELERAPTDWGAGTAGETQAIPLRGAVRSVRLEVLEVYSVGFPWGSPGELGLAAFGPARCDFGVEVPCADPRLRALEVSVSRTPPGPVRLRLSDADGNEFAATLRDVPAQPTRRTVALADFHPLPGAILPLNPYRLSALCADSGYADAWTGLSFRLVNAPGAEPGWQALPPVARAMKRFDGLLYTEGLSATSVGRFGNSPVNGLLTETVEGLRLRVATPRAPGHEWDAEAFELRLPGATGEPAVRCRPGFAAATLHYAYPGGATVTQRLSSAAPGFLLETGAGRLTLAPTGAGALPRRSGQPNEPEDKWRLRAGSGPAAAQGALVYADAAGGLRLAGPADSPVTPAEPWCVAVFGHADRPATLAGDRAVAIMLTAEHPAQVRWTGDGLELRAGGALGTVGLSSAFTGLLADGWDPAAVAGRARLLTRLLRTFPDACREWYRVGDDAVAILGEFGYHRWGDPAWQAPEYSPVPPLYAATSHPLVAGGATGIQTRFGPYVTRPGSRLSYRLPLLPFEHAAFPRTGMEADLVRALTDSVRDLAARPALRPDWFPWQPTLYDGWPSALLAAPLYEPAVTDRLLARARAGIELAFAPRVWLRRTELYSGRPYVATGWFDRNARPPMIGDPNSAAGSALYSLYLYALYSGDEAAVRRVWPAATDVVRFLETVNDWAVPQTSSREAANYSGIDMDTIAHLGLGGYWWLASKLGSREEADHAAYLYAKVAPVAALRFLFPRVTDPRNQEPALLCDGFSEEGPTLRILADDVVIKDCVAMCLSWCGQQPEMYRFLMDFLGPAECRRFQSEVLDRHLPGWRRMDYNRTRVASHLAQRAWLPDWPAADLSLDLPAFTQLMGAPCPETAGLIALLQGRGLPTLVDWWPKRLVRLDWIAEGGELRVSLQGGPGTTLQFRWPEGTPRARVNGREARSCQVSRRRPVWCVAVPQGTAEVSVVAGG